MQHMCPIQWLTGHHQFKCNKNIVFVGQLCTSVPISQLHSEHTLLIWLSKSMDCKKPGGIVVTGLIQLSKVMKNRTKIHDNTIQELKCSVYSWDHMEPYSSETATMTPFITNGEKWDLYGPICHLLTCLIQFQLILLQTCLFLACAVKRP